MKPILAFAGVLAVAALLTSQPAGRQLVGALPDGGFLLPTGWKVQPAGEQIPLDTLPMSSVLSPDGKYLLVLNGGYKPPTLAVLDAATSKTLDSAAIGDGWLGLAITRDNRIYIGGGSRGRVFEFTLDAAGKLARGREFELVADTQRTHRDFIGDVAVSSDGRLVYAAELFHDRIAVINTQSGRVIERFKTGRRPYRILFHPDGRSYFVSSWADGTVYHHDSLNGAQLGFVRVGPHTTDMVWSSRRPTVEEDQEQPAYQARIFVTASNTNNVYSIGVTEAKDLKLTETINVAMTPRHPLGMTPSALALSPDQTQLFVACSDANAVAVADVSTVRTRVQGFIPTGWYPTAVRKMADGRLLVLNGKGLRSFPNPNGPGPVRRPNPEHGGVAVVQYVGRMQTGTMSVIPQFTQEQLDAYTRQTLSNSPYRDQLLDHVETGPNNPVPTRPGNPSPIEHVIYIVKENRTYDQVLGDFGKGNGDPSLTLFKEDSTPNHRKLAGEFVLLDNFYVNSDVSADGHNWVTAAIAPDYVQKMWPNSYAGRRRHYDYEGGEPAATPPAGYIWTNVLAAGLTMRNYGYFVTNRKAATPDGDQIEVIRDPALIPVTNRKFRGFDMDYPDLERARVFIEDVKQFTASGRMPRFMIMRIGNDHTSGTSPNKIAPLSAMADNDWAIGQIVEAVSKSPFWARTAIFVLEDDAQNGPDHVDSHRSPAYVLSPYTRRGGIVDSTMYNQTSMLRTMELILGLRPLTHYDAGARPMASVFAAKPDLTPYVAVKPQRALDERNPAASATAARSLRMDFTEADKIDDDELNDILWRAIRGTEPPAPTRSIFSSAVARPSARENPPSPTPLTLVPTRPLSPHPPLQTEPRPPGSGTPQPISHHRP